MYVRISKGTQLTGTNRTIGLITRIIRDFAVVTETLRGHTGWPAVL